MKRGRASLGIGRRNQQFRMKRSGVAVGLGLTLAFAALALAAPRNGGFETGNFSGGWKVKDPGGGNWYVYDGRSVVEPPGPRGLGGPQFYRPPRGRYAAAAYQFGPGLNILHRRLRLKEGEANKLSFLLAWDNNGGQFVTPDNFDFDDGGAARGMVGPPENPNQQFRIDILKPNAPVDTLRDRQILATLFKVRPNTQDRRRYKKERFNLTALGLDGTVRFRVAEVDNQGELPVGIDAVKLKSKPFESHRAAGISASN